MTAEPPATNALVQQHDFPLVFAVSTALQMPLLISFHMTLPASWQALPFEVSDNRENSCLLVKSLYIVDTVLFSPHLHFLPVPSLTCLVFALQYMRHHGVEYELLSLPTNEANKSFDLVFQVAERLEAFKLNR